MAEFAKMCQNDDGLKMKSNKTSNSQFNAIIGWIHQTIVNIIRTFDVSNIVSNYLWSGTLAATMFVVRETYHTTLQTSSMQLVFFASDFLNIKHDSTWEHIWQRKQERINCNHKRENMRRNNHQYKVGEKIIVKRNKISKHEIEFMSPSLITNECWRNGQTVNGQVMSWRVIITSHLKDENAVVAEK